MSVEDGGFQRRKQAARAEMDQQRYEIESLRAEVERLHQLLREEQIVMRGKLGEAEAENETLRAAIANWASFTDAVKTLIAERMDEQKHEIRRLKAERDANAANVDKMADEVERLRELHERSADAYFKANKAICDRESEDAARSMRERIDAAVDKLFRTNAVVSRVDVEETIAAVPLIGEPKP